MRRPLVPRAQGSRAKHDVAAKGGVFGRPQLIHACDRHEVYFCDPQSPWQRGSNENTNGLLRQYLPTGIDISSYSQATLNAVARQFEPKAEKDSRIPDAG